jgi:hypothetical protein
MTVLAEYRPVVEALTPLIALAPLGLGILGLAYSDKQKKWFHERDDERCQLEKAKVPHECNGSVKLPVEKRKNHVHHIIPQRYAEEVGIKNPDTDLNGILICKNIHVGDDPNVIHPDIAKAKTKADFTQVFEERQKKLKKRQRYWNDMFDSLLHIISMKNTQKAEEKGLKFPKKKKQKPF